MDVGDRADEARTRALLGACLASFLAYLVASHTVRFFLAELDRLIRKFLL